MGKIVKYCSSCDEGFVERFGFCPNCAAPLQAFEMNPVEAPKPAPAEPVSEPPVPEVLAKPEPAPRMEEPVLEMPPVVAAIPIIEEPAYEEPAYEEPVIEDPIVEEPVVAAAPEPEPIRAEEPVVEEAPRSAPKTRAVPVTAPIFAQSTPVDVDRMPTSFEAEHDRYIADGGFYVTVIEEKNSKQRNALLVGALGLILVLFMSGLVISIFSKDLEVGSINDDIFNAVIVDDIPTKLEEEIQKKNNDKGGGGGGGGREEKEEVTQGDLADQAKNPTRPPDAKVFRSDNFELKTPPPQTEGNMKFEKKFDRWGDPNGRFASFSNGTGSGGGQGSGVGTGQGSGRGTGAGSGTGSGYGGGIGNGNGNGTGDGDGGAPPPKVAGVSQGIKILSKPRPGYTDAARQNNIQGTVILRVTFQANGQIGGISPVKGLGNGLTEQAIAAARRISFEPAKVNGVPQSVTKQIEYTFSIY